MRDRRAKTWVLVVLLALLGLGGVLLLQVPDTSVASPSPPSAVAPPPDGPPPVSPPSAAYAEEPTPPQRSNPKAPTDQDLGLRFIRESAKWIALGAAPSPAVKSAYWELDAKFDLDDTHSEGPMRLWLQAPNLYRQQTVLSGGRRTRMLNADGVWTANPAASGKFTREDPDGGERRQALDDYERLLDLSMFMTLRGLEGPAVTFEYEGEKKPSGTYARPGGGTWLKVVRKAPGRPDIRFWLAHESDVEGVVHATFPGVVRVAGEPQNDIATEDYVLGEWEEPPAHSKRLLRIPRTIRALQSRPGVGPVEFLRATVLDFAVDASIEASVFTTSEAWITRPESVARGR